MDHHVDEPFKHIVVQGYQFGESPAMETCLSLVLCYGPLRLSLYKKQTVLINPSNGKNQTADSGCFTKRSSKMDHYETTNSTT